MSKEKKLGNGRDISLPRPLYKWSWEHRRLPL